MFKLESNDFKGIDVSQFLSYHKWNETMSDQYQELIITVSKTGELTHKSETVLGLVKGLLEYGGYSAEITQ